MQTVLARVSAVLSPPKAAPGSSHPHLANILSAGFAALVKSGAVALLLSTLTTANPVAGGVASAVVMLITSLVRIYAPDTPALAANVAPNPPSVQA